MGFQPESKIKIMKKFIRDLTVRKNERLNSSNVLLKLTSSERLPEILPGQFVQVKVENSPTTFLRRPISVHYVDYETNELWLLVQIVGDGTRKLSKLQESDTLNLIFPLGNSFTLPEKKDAKILLVGGGVGIAPLLYWSSILKAKGYVCTFLLGGKSKENLIQLAEFEKAGEVLTTTEDGSLGEQGFVTQHSVLSETKFDAIYTCGPTPMMKAVAEYAKQTNTFCEVSLENTMACGIGACLCCVTDTMSGHVCVCTEGAVFNITKLKW